ncbi:ABC transporter substrate-binding protein [Corynebacterium cystitidis]|uniref:ABC transporter substrate-binding protein n=1 Tax=Corynebacterium cystitidis TaxID=35757 RepID=UPI00211ED591|nr:ABC transporter substrate-binding protein [Corynebacterium cystitidis]
MLRAPKQLTVAALTAVAVLATSCGTESASNDEATNTDAATKIVTDQRGEDVAIPADVERIASAVIPAPTLIAALDGSWDRIAGINQVLMNSNKQGIAAKIFPESLETPIVSDQSFTPNMETLLGLEPDVFIQWGDRSDDIIQPVEAAGIATVGLEYGTQEDLETWVEIFGQVIGKEERAQEFLDYMEEEKEAVTSGVAALGADKVRGIELNYGSESMTVRTQKDYAHDVFEAVGIENMGAQAPTSDGVVSPEQLLAWDPEIIFLSSFSDTTPDDIYNDPRFADITAVKDKRVYRTPVGMFRWQVPCEEAPLYWHWVAALTYPGEYKVDLPEFMKEKIQWMYNYELEDEDYDLILRTDINNVSANYDYVTQ